MEPAGFFKKLNTTKEELVNSYQQQPRRFIILSVALVLFVCLIFNIYFILDYVDPSITDQNMIARGIETPIKMILNGYLGHFFAFSYLGNLNWLMLPILLYFLVTIKQRTRWEIALFAFYLIAIALICVKGYFNRRYAVTLLPVTLTIVVYYLWEAMKFLRFLKLFKYIVFFILIVIFYNDIKYVFHLGKPKITIAEKIHEPLSYRLKMKIIKSYHSIDSITNLAFEKPQNIPIYTFYFFKNIVVSNFYLIYNRTLYFKSKPNEMIAYINQLKMNKEDRILNNNLPLQYYYTNKRGLYYWCEDDDYYTPKGKSKLLAKYQGAQLSKHLLNDLRCKYIFSFDVYNLYNMDWFNYLNNYCTVVFCDDSGYLLYKINPVE